MSTTHQLSAQTLSQLRAVDGASVDTLTTFAQLTTLHIGGAPLLTIRCGTQEAVVQVVSLLDAAGVPLLIVGGGSNLVVADGQVPVVAVVLECAGIKVAAGPGEGTALLRAEAGAVWDDTVAYSLGQGLGGLECLSGIPGSTGATPVQNVGAYGVEVSDVLTGVKLFDRATGEVAWHPAESLELRYRYSNLKFTARAVVLEVEFALTTDGLSAPLRFGGLTAALGAEQGERRPAGLVRDTVLAIRRDKGMVYDEGDHDTWSAGSFFTNPIVSPAVAAQVVEFARQREGEAVRVPVFDAVDAQGAPAKKLSAAWLIDHAGIDKGFPGEGAPARVSTKHTLALTNRGGAATADVVDLARRVRAGVADVFGVILEPEPVWVGVAIDADRP